MARLTFHGAARTVTGSRFLLEADGTRVLVDCGMFQGLKELRERNWEPPGFKPGSLDAVVLTHAHIDHSGYLPRIVRNGFSGPIHATPGTADLAELLLHDAASIQEEDAEYANKKGFSRHKPALPLYTNEDVDRTVRMLNVVDYGAWTGVGDSVRFRFRHAGHILGSGIVELEFQENGRRQRVLFSGDLGRYDAPLVPDPDEPEPCDVLVIESTYGDRDHPTESVPHQLTALVKDVVQSGGTLLFPAFAVGRAQQLIYLLRREIESGRAPELAIHLDSPMAVNATKIYCRYPEEHGLEEVDMQPGDCILYDRNVHLHRTRDDSIRLNGLEGPRILISSSGMLAGGRVLHHLRRLLPDPKNILALVGFQARGTRGWRLQNGERSLRIHGGDVPVRARLAELSGLSAHADRGQLLRWLAPLEKPPRQTFIVHGEEDAALAFAEQLRKERGFACTVPALGQTFTL